MTAGTTFAAMASAATFKTIQCGYFGLIILLLTSAFSSQAQYNISGNVTNEQNEPIPYADIILLNSADSMILRTEVADSSGHYSLVTSGVSHVLLKIIAVGFANKIYAVTDTVNFAIKLDFILAADNHELGAVTVSAQKPLFERKADRIIFNVASSMTAIGGNALDAVKKAPGVIVKQEDNSINLAGKSGVVVLLNGRPLQLTGDDLVSYLQSIPSDDIDRIEVITTPPAQYDAAGNSGLINIVLKKNNRNGFNGDVRAGYEQSVYGTGIGGINFNYRAGKWNLYGSASYTDGAKDIIETVNTYYPTGAALLADAYKKTTRGLQYILGVDYQVHKNGILGVQFTGSDIVRLDNENIKIQNLTLNNPVPDSTVHTNAWQHGKKDDNSLNLNYVWNIDTAGKKLTVNANRLWYTNDKNRQYETRDYYGNFLSPTGVNSMNINTGNQNIHIATAQTDVELPDKLVNVSFGAKASFIDNNSDNGFLYYANGNYINDPAISDNFSYTENVQALYLSLQKTLLKWNFQAGLRGEATQIRSYSISQSLGSNGNYANVFPTAYAGYTFDKDNVLNINFSKRINRPGYADMDPFRLYTTPYSYTEGNLFLRPSYSQNLELNYVWKGRFNFTAFYQFEQNSFGKLFFTDSNSIYVKSANYGNNSSYGITVLAPYNPLPWWNMQVQASGYVQETEYSFYTATAQRYQKPAFYISDGNSFALNRSKTLLAELDMVYESGYLSDLFYRKPDGGVDAGIKSLFLDKKLVISLTANDVLATQRARGTNVVTGQTINDYFDTRNIRLILNYKFGNNKIKEKRERSTGIEGEQSRT